MVTPAKRPKGITCPACDSRRLPALYTRRRGGFVIRVRQCRECKLRLKTKETILGAPDERQ
jgi:transcriptional regulator NrdR family protein